MTALRQRKTAGVSSSSSSPATAAAVGAPQGPSTSAKKGTRARTPQFGSRLKLILLALPLLFGWFVVISRRQLPKPLPQRFAICSARGRRQVQVDAGNVESREECLVVQQGKITASGSLAMVRSVYGDKDTKGKSQPGGGIKIIFLRKGELLLPGL